jgi:hypothetical protein
MKLSSAIVLAVSAATASASGTIRSATATAELMNAARRLTDDSATHQYTFLEGYSTKLIGCVAGKDYTNPSTGTTEYSSVIFRLCPKKVSDCCISA